MPSCCCSDICKNAALYLWQNSGYIGQYDVRWRNIDVIWCCGFIREWSCVVLHWRQHQQQAWRHHWCDKCSTLFHCYWWLRVSVLLTIKCIQFRPLIISVQYFAIARQQTYWIITYLPIRERNIDWTAYSEFVCHVIVWQPPLHCWWVPCHLIQQDSESWSWRCVSCILCYDFCCCESLCPSWLITSISLLPTRQHKIICERIQETCLSLTACAQFFCDVRSSPNLSRWYRRSVSFCTP